MIWNKEMECRTRSQIETLQLERLKATVERVYEKVPSYRAKMDAMGVKPKHIQKLADLALLPFTLKNDLRDNYPFGLFAVDKSKIVRLHASSGTTGKPIVVGYTKNDLDNWSELVARVATMVSVGNNDTAQISFNYGLFTGGFGLHYGLEKVGVSVIPISGGNTQKQLMIMQDFGTTVLIATPSYALHIAEVGEAMGIDFDKLPLRVGLFGGEPWTNEMRHEIEKRLHIVATDNYGLSEVMGPGVSGECIFGTGMHIAEDHFIAETINPETGEVLPPGSQGEMVFTSLTKEAFPIIRYRTKDISRINQEPCVCGNTHARMQKLIGRSDDMMIIRGVNVFPSQIEGVLLGFTQLGPQYQIHISRKGYLDTLDVHVELLDSSLLESYGVLEALTREIEAKILSVLGVHCTVKLAEPASFERSAGKAKRVFDHRKENLLG
ncbi:MAG: phenylacetate--CoA ligase [Clostridia bacterium]|jgi:phenylacetate-CoA ligase|nr:phenylacetate--CoA ligase [Clostridia bacterium]MDD4571693.1 phenylacetate--CoA ligase [Clostridia bacterium]